MRRLVVRTVAFGVIVLGSARLAAQPVHDPLMACCSTMTGSMCCGANLCGSFLWFCWAN